MAKKSTKTMKDVAYSGSLFDMLDSEVERKRFQEVNKKAEEALFENDHKTEELQKVYDKIDTKTVNQHIHDDAYDDFNPFYGDKNALNTLRRRHSYQEVVSTQAEEPTIEIKEEIKLEPEKKTQRKKLWFITGGVCIALLLTLFTYNMININSLARKVATTQNDISQQEQILQQGNEEYFEKLQDYDLIASEGMVEADRGNATGVDLSAKNPAVENNAPTNFWDKVCNFFAKLFGR